MIKIIIPKELTGNIRDRAYMFVKAMIDLDHVIVINPLDDFEELLYEKMCGNWSKVCEFLENGRMNIDGVEEDVADVEDKFWMEYKIKI